MVILFEQRPKRVIVDLGAMVYDILQCQRMTPILDRESQILKLSIYLIIGVPL